MPAMAPDLLRIGRQPIPPAKQNPPTERLAEAVPTRPFWMNFGWRFVAGDSLVGLDHRHGDSSPKIVGISSATVGWMAITRA